jgi:hypothetical protein
MKKVLCSILFTFLFLGSSYAGQDTTRRKADIRRVKFHEDIDRLQIGILASDGRSDLSFSPSADDEINQLLTDVFTRRVDALQDSIEYSTVIDHRLKVKYLSGLEQVLKAYLGELQKKTGKPESGILLFSAYDEAVRADIAGRPIGPVLDNYPFEVSQILILGPSTVFFENPGYADARVLAFRKFCKLYPEKVITRMEEFHNVPFADSLIISCARKYPNQFYDYAAASQTKLGQLIRRSEDTLVKTITAISESRSGRLYFPFLDQIIKGRLTLDDVNKAMKDSLQYYRLMVQTQVEYADRMRMRDTPIAAEELPRMLKRKAEEVFINQINALHDSPDAVRFRILEPFNSRELYYLIVLGEEIIYTSSYKGVYNRMMDRLPEPGGDKLLMSVRFDRFKKFIKMAAGYNKLDPFLSSMPDSNAQRLMIAFARGLDKTGGLEEAVDVADSYGSITTQSVKTLIDREISSSLDASRSGGNRRSIVIYDILQNIFRSSSDASFDISGKLGIPPVYKLSYPSLTDSSGRVIQLAFFYGDKDGMESFANFMGLFNNRPEWVVSRGKEWVEIKSAKGSKVWIYANLPLDNSNGTDPDAKAQEHLLAYLNERGLQPAVVIHRGHSYHLKYTLKQLPLSARIVILGSCGGYHNLDDVLNRCPDAHIISSKEVGTRTVNEPILRSINEDLRNGRDVEWIPMWKGLSTQFTNPEARERFDNYIPPHKNLGALFIKAYNKAMSDPGSE